MILTLLATLISLVILGYIFLYYTTRRRYLWYKTTYEKLGYKVKVFQFKLLNAGLLPIMKQNGKKYADPQYIIKTQFPKYDIVLLSLLTKIEVILIKPELIRNFLSPNNFYTYPKLKLITSNLTRVFGEGILFSENDIWKRKRKVITQVFNHQLLVANIPKISSICDQVMEKTQQPYPDPNSETKNLVTLDLGANYKETFSRVMLRCFFGKDLKDEKINGENISNFFARLVGDLNLQARQLRGLILGTWVFNLGLTERDRDINNRTKIAKSLSKQFIQERLQKLKKQDLKNQKSSNIIQALYKYHQSLDKNNSEDSYNFSQLIDEFLTFYIAGTDTTANFTRTMLYYIGLNLKVQQKLRQEIDSIIKKQSDITWENLKKLQYIDWIQNQTIRIYGPVNSVFIREAMVDNMVLDVPIKKGDLALYFSTPNHYNAQIFKNPQQFRPQRWESQCNNIEQFSLVGFSGGPRSCVGRTLALLQNKIAIIKFMKRYKSIKLAKDKIQYQLCFVVEAKQIQTILEKAC